MENKVTAAPTSALVRETRVQATNENSPMDEGFCTFQGSSNSPFCSCFRARSNQPKNPVLLSEEEAEGAAQRELSCLGSLSLAVCSEQ